jgi:hypothetical protein
MFEEGSLLIRSGPNHGFYVQHGNIRDYEDVQPMIQTGHKETTEGFKYWRSFPGTLRRLKSIFAR